MSTHTITARTSVIGLHQWPDAPGRRAYLRDLHRHVFGIAVTVDVTHTERDVEWHDLADDTLTAALALTEPYHEDALITSFGARSCETIASEIADALTSQEYTVQSVEVDEDGEHTATWRNQ